MQPENHWFRTTNISRQLLSERLCLGTHGFRMLVSSEMMVWRKLASKKYCFLNDRVWGPLASECWYLKNIGFRNKYLKASAFWMLLPANHGIRIAAIWKLRVSWNKYLNASAPLRQNADIWSIPRIQWFPAWNQRTPAVSNPRAAKGQCFWFVCTRYVWWLPMSTSVLKVQPFPRLRHYFADSAIGASIFTTCKFFL